MFIKKKKKSQSGGMNGMNLYRNFANPTTSPLLHVSQYNVATPFSLLSKPENTFKVRESIDFTPHHSMVNEVDVLNDMNDVEDMNDVDDIGYALLETREARRKRNKRSLNEFQFQEQMKQEIEGLRRRSDEEDRKAADALEEFKKRREEEEKVLNEQRKQELDEFKRRKREQDEKDKQALIEFRKQREAEDRKQQEIMEKFRLEKEAEEKEEKRKLDILNEESKKKEAEEKARFSRLYAQPNSRDNMVSILNDALKSITADVTTEILKTIHDNLRFLQKETSITNWRTKDYKKLTSVIRDLRFLSFFPEKDISLNDQEKLFLASRRLEEFAKSVVKDPTLFTSNLQYYFDAIKKGVDVQNNIENAATIINFVGTHISAEILMNDLKKYSPVMDHQFNVDMVETVEELLRMPGREQVQAAAYKMPTTPVPSFELTLNVEPTTEDHEMYDTLVNLYKTVAIIAVSYIVVKWLSRWKILPGTKMTMKRRKTGYYLTGKDMKKRNVSIKIDRPSILIREAIENGDLVTTL